MNNYQIITLKKDKIDDFAEERNTLLKSAKSEWVLFLDTDEKMPRQLINEIENLDPKNLNGYYIKRKIVFLGKIVGEDKVLRLAKKGSGKWERKVHEVWKVEGQVGTLKNYLIHDTGKDLHSYIDKINFYSTLHALENKKEGKKSNIFKIIIYPKLKFIQNILSGRGLLFSMLQSFHSFLGWSKLWELQRKSN